MVSFPTKFYFTSPCIKMRIYFLLATASYFPNSVPLAKSSVTCFWDTLTPSSSPDEARPRAFLPNYFLNLTGFFHCLNLQKQKPLLVTSIGLYWNSESSVSTWSSLNTWKKTDKKQNSLTKINSEIPRRKKKCTSLLHFVSLFVMFHLTWN